MVRPGDLSFQGVDGQRPVADDSILRTPLHIVCDRSGVNITLDGGIFARRVEAISEDVENVSEEGRF